MTVGNRVGQRTLYGILGALVSLASLILAVCVCLFLSGETKEYAYSALTLCARVILPSLFPFFILSDIYAAFGAPERITPLSRIFSLLFGTERGGVSVYICGALFGFPLGARLAAQMCECKELSHRSAERLIAYSNLPSAAFVIASVGMGMLNSQRLGIMLFLSCLSSSVICGLIFRGNAEKCINTGHIMRQKFSLVNSIRSAGLNSVCVCSFIVAFFCLAEALCDLLLGTPFFALIAPFIEVSFASHYFSSLLLSSGDIYYLFALGFALGFGGISVFMQSRALLIGSGISLKKYLPIKLTQGLISGGISVILFPLFK